MTKNSVGTPPVPKTGLIVGKAQSGKSVTMVTILRKLIRADNNGVGQ